jgi:hypothetical protein
MPVRTHIEAWIDAEFEDGCPRGNMGIDFYLDLEPGQ